MEISNGTVIKRSTSSGDFPVACVAINTCTFVTSGKASTDSLFNAEKPATNKAKESTTTTKRCLRAPRIMDSIMAYSNSLRLRSLFTWNAPSVTMVSPSSTPLTIATMPLNSSPISTSLKRYLLEAI